MLERGAVEGEIFHRGAVHALGPEETQVTTRLAALVRQELIRPERAAAPRRRRLPLPPPADPRRRLRRPAQGTSAPTSMSASPSGSTSTAARSSSCDEIVGYHLEQAARYLDELGRPDPEVSIAGGDHFGVAGERAYWRGDWRTAVGLLDRALALTRPYRFDLRLEVRLADALYWIDVARAATVAEAAAARAATTADAVDAALARTVAALAVRAAGRGSFDEVERAAREALPVLEAADDEDGLVHVWYALAWVGNMRSRHEDWAEAMETGLRHVRRAGHPVQGWFAVMLAVPLALGPRPASEALATLDAALADQPYAGCVLVRALLLAMLDRIDEAWAVALPAEQRVRGLGLATGGEWLGEIALVAGDSEAAADHLRDACAALEANNNLLELSTYAPMRGRVSVRSAASTRQSHSRFKGASSVLTTTRSRRPSGARSRHV